MIFDTHSHYDDEAFDEDREALLCNMRTSGVERIVNVGADIVSSRTALALAERYDFMYCALGVHPSETGSLTEADMDWIREHANHKKVVAIGEFGLDYHWPEPDAATQKKWFYRQIELAKEVQLPIIKIGRASCRERV